MNIDMSIKLQTRNEIDSEILHYVREMQRLAPVQLESVCSFLQVQRRRQVTTKEVQDRLDYLCDAKYLKLEKDWQGGELRHYRITADGMDFMDGAIPPRGWKG